MATEIELKLSLPARAANQLAQHALLCDIAPHRQLLVNTYYDTPDRRLRSEGVVMRYRKKGDEWVFGIKTAAQGTGGLAQRKEWERVGRPETFDFSHVDQSAVRDLLEAQRDQLQPVFTTRFQRCAWLLEPRQGVRIELALDRGTIEAAGRRQTICEVELELLDGELSELFKLATALQATVPLHPEVSSKADRAYQLLLDAPLNAAKALPVPVEAELSTIAAFRRIALSCVNQLQRNEQGVCETDAPEFVHQARVAIRRLRSALRVWRRTLPAPFLARFDPLWQGIAAKLGEARNWDVFLSGTLQILHDTFPERAETHQLRRYAGRRCASNRRLARSVFRSADYSRLLLDFTAALLALPEDRAAPLASALPAWLDKCTRRVNQRAVEAQGGDDVARHRLRLAFKQLRYALEFFSPILAGPALDKYHQALTALQEQLGSQNDLAVAMQLTSEALPGGKAGVLLDWLSAQSEALLPELERLLDDFRRQDAPWSPRQP